MNHNPLETYKTAVARTPAYRDFLQKKLGAIPAVETADDFLKLPLMDKPGYLMQHPLDRICLDGSIRCAHIICRSSGSTARPFYWPQMPDQERDLAGWLSIELENTFSVSSTPTLAVISLALGDWISGELASWTMRTMAMQQRNITMMTPGMDRDEVVQILSTFSPRYGQTIIYGYPPHVKSSIETAIEQGIPVRDFKIKLRLAGEGYTEKYRDYMNHLLGYEPGSIFSISSGYASTDFGRVGRETPLTVTLRRILHEKGLCTRILGCDTLPSLCQFNPAGFHLECAGPDLVITKLQAVPLVRYRTGDHGEIIPFEEMLGRFRAAGIDPLVELARRGGKVEKIERLPFVLVHGRADGGITFHAANIHICHIRDILENEPAFRDGFTGNFQIRKTQDEKLDPVMELVLEEKHPGACTPGLPGIFAEALMRRSNEYTLIVSQRGEQAHPVIIPVSRDYFLNNPKIRYFDKGQA